MSIIGDLFGANKAAKAQKQAAQAASDAAAASLAQQQLQYNQSRADMQPWLTVGQGALSQIAGQYGIPTTQGANAAPQAGNYGSFMASPDYQFRQDEQMRALNARNAALGIQDSGAATKAALQYSGNLASGEYGNWYNRLANISGLGQTAANSNAAIGSNYASAVTNINQYKANALGSSYINRGNIWGNYLSDLGGQFSQAASLYGGRMF